MLRIKGSIASSIRSVEGLKEMLHYSIEIVLGEVFKNERTPDAAIDNDSNS